MYFIECDRRNVVNRHRKRVTDQQTYAKRLLLSISKCKGQRYYIVLFYRDITKDALSFLLRALTINQCPSTILTNAQYIVLNFSNN